MEKLLIPVLLCAVYIPAAAQSSYVGTPQVSVKNLVPQSPQAGQLARVNEITVNSARGVPQVAFTLYTASAGSLKIPISVSYDASGIKYDDIPSAVGLKWSLQAGGEISRNINGMDDESFYFANAYKYSQSIIDSWNLATDSVQVFLTDVWRGAYIYKTSSGIVQSVFDTKYGLGRSPESLGNIANYSKNAQWAIRTTKFLRGASNTLIVGGLVMDWGQVAYAIATDDPNKNVFVMKAGLNTTVTAIGVLVPGVGWVISGLYFLGDAIIPGGWGGALDASYQNTLHNREIIPNWNPRPGGGLGN